MKKGIKIFWWIFLLKGNKTLWIGEWYFKRYWTLFRVCYLWNFSKWKYKEVKITYSGGLENVIILIIESLTIFTEDDYVILETTYSNIFHNKSLIKIIQSIIKN